MRSSGSWDRDGAEELLVRCAAPGVALHAMKKEGRNRGATNFVECARRLCIL